MELSLISVSAAMLLSAAVFPLTGGHANSCQKPAQSCESSIYADDIASLDNTCIGYGQGHECDERNRPCGALMFSERYGRYDAYAIADCKGLVCLTFDQGYENGFTDDILDTLKDKNVKAVFFLTGDYSEREPELVQRMIDEGHVIGNHGMKHASLPSLSCADAEDEIMSLHRKVKERYGYDMDLLRPPCGEYSEQKLALAQSLGYKTILWSYAYCDWDTEHQPEKSAALEKAVDAAHDGAIYLLHSVSETNCNMLGELIDRLREKGYGFAVPS